MPVTVQQPVPIPTPWQPASMGGNPQVPPGTTGPMVGSWQPYTSPVSPYSAVISPPPSNNNPPPAPTNNNGGGGGGGSGGISHDEAISRGWDVNNLPSGYYITGGGGGNGGGGMPDVSELYAPALSALSEREAQLRAGNPEDQALIEANAANEAKKYTGEQESLLGGTQVEEDKYNKVIQTALEDAMRAFNALTQQRRSRFGFGSSAGQAVGELAQQEYFRQQGQINAKQAEGTQAFATERGRIKTYISQKLSDLDLQKKEALRQLQKDFEDRINEIAMRRGDIEANKGRDKMMALQTAINDARSLASADREFRSQLGMAAISKMQEIANRAFTPKEIIAYLQDFGINLGGQVYNTGAMPKLNYNPNFGQYDELGNKIA